MCAEPRGGSGLRGATAALAVPGHRLAITERTGTPAMPQLSVGRIGTEAQIRISSIVNGRVSSIVNGRVSSIVNGSLFHIKW